MKYFSIVLFMLLFRETLLFENVVSHFFLMKCNLMSFYNNGTVLNFYMHCLISFYELLLYPFSR